MHRDFDDFQDEYDQVREDHSNSLDHDQYGEYFDPNSEQYYDLDVFSPEHAKSLFYSLGDQAQYKGFNRVGELLQLQDYLDADENSVEIPKDNPHDLYHLNNQTVLDPATMPGTPINPGDFVKKVVDELTKLKVLISNDTPDLLERMCRLFNFSIRPNEKLPRTVKNLVFPAETGVGKSVSLQVYVSMLKQHSSVVVVAKVEEAINYCKFINEMAGDDAYARCYYAVTDKNSLDSMRVEAAGLKHHRCIVITHNMFRRVNGFDDVDCFRNYQERPRDFVAIDEKLSFCEQFILDYRQLDKLINNIEEAIQESSQLGAIDTSQRALEALKEFKDFLLFKDDKIVTNDNSITIRKELEPKAKADLLAIGEAVTLSKLSDRRRSPMKLIDLKSKDSALDVLQSNNVETQARRRKVIGISSREVERLGDTIRESVNPFYSDRFDPPIASYSTIEPGSLMDDREFMSLFDDDDFDGELTEEQVKAFHDLEKARNEQYGLEFVSSVIRVLLETRVDELLARLEELGANKNRAYRQNTLNAINEQLSALKYFSKHNFLIYKTNHQKALLATENLINQLGVSVVLDATAQINEYYQLANRFLGQVGFVSAPRIRQYQNLEIHKATGFSQARSALYRNKTSEEIHAIAKSYASYALNELGDDDKMLLICHKDFVSAIKKQINDQRVEYTHWGNHVGRNVWSHCNKVMLIGWNYLPPIEHVSTINSSLESVLLTSRHLDDELIDKFEISQLADDIVQGLMRSKARTITTKESDCKPTSFYIFSKDDDKSRKVLALVEAQFPLSTINTWIPNGTSLPKKKSKRNRKDDEVIEYLVEKSKDHETYLRKDLENELNINKSTMGRIINRKYFKEHLTKNGITFTNKDAKSQQFILK